MLDLWKNNYEKPRQCIKKKRHHFADQSLYRQSYSFSSIRYECESWTIKKAEPQRIDAFETVMLEKTLESPLDSKELKPVNLKGNQPKYSLEGLMLKVQSFGGRADSLEKTLMLVKI